jgi:hypothetical protein
MREAKLSQGLTSKRISPPHLVKFEAKKERCRLKRRLEEAEGATPGLSA